MKGKDELIDLLQQIARGDEQAFRQFYDLTSARLFGVALKLLKRRDWAEDVTQEVYVRVWYHAREYHNGRGSPMTWLISISRNLAIDKLRSRSAREAAGGQEPDLLSAVTAGPYSSSLNLESKALLQGCIEELSEPQKTSIFLSFFEGLSHQQITTHLDEPLGTIKSWIRRGLQSLRRCLER